MRVFPDLETLPYDSFSAHPDITSARLATLAELPRARKGVWLVAIETLLQRLAPRSYVEAYSLKVHVGETLDMESLRTQLATAGYAAVTQVVAHGEFAVRGSLLDVFPMGSDRPYRIDMLDRDVDSIRFFDPDTQRSGDKLDRIQLLPARETPLNPDAVREFRRRYRLRFSGDLTEQPVYRDVSAGQAPGGLEFFLPLFFERTSHLFEYLPPQSVLIDMHEATSSVQSLWQGIVERHEQLRHDRRRPILDPPELYLSPAEFLREFAAWPQDRSCAPSNGRPKPRGRVQNFSSVGARRDSHRSARRAAGRRARGTHRLESRPGAARRRIRRSARAAARSAARSRRSGQGLRQFCELHRRATCNSASRCRPRYRRCASRRRRSRSSPSRSCSATGRGRSADGGVPSAIRPRYSRSCPTCAIGAPVVHESYGVGRYVGLQTMDVAGYTGEFLVLEYADGDKLYVPVQALHLVSRYTGAPAETAPLHKLGGEQWQKARRKAAQRIRDVAAELLDLYSRRAAREGTSHARRRGGISGVSSGISASRKPPIKPPPSIRC